MLKIGDSVLKNFKYSQEDVINFAKISGDMNPIHFRQRIFKKHHF
jgi:acyl dehydratase